MSEGTNLEEYRELAKVSGGYREIEIDMLGDILAAWKDDRRGPDFLAEVRDGHRLAAFAVVGRVPGRENTVQLRYLCIAPEYRHTKAGRKALEQADEELMLRSPRQVVQVETSTKKLGQDGLALLEGAGYAVMGHIPDFYGRGNDFYMLSKHLVRPVFDRDEPGRPADADRPPSRPE